ncbi:MAG: oxidase, partial [Oricola sp.]
KTARDLEKERAAQRRLARIYANDGAARLAALPAETVICRCENKTLGDLQALGAAPTDRELRLTGRFAMGRCQGRFCAEWVRALAGLQSDATQIGAMRLPVRPIAIADLIAVEDHTENSVTGDTP